MVVVAEEEVVEGIDEVRARLRKVLRPNSQGKDGLTDDAFLRLVKNTRGDWIEVRREEKWREEHYPSTLVCYCVRL